MAQRELYYGFFFFFPLLFAQLLQHHRATVTTGHCLLLVLLPQLCHLTLPGAASTCEPPSSNGLILGEGGQDGAPGFKGRVPTGRLPQASADPLCTVALLAVPHVHAQGINLTDTTIYHPVKYNTRTRDDLQLLWEP